MLWNQNMFYSVLVDGVDQVYWKAHQAFSFLFNLSLVTNISSYERGLVPEMGKLRNVSCVECKMPGGADHRTLESVVRCVTIIHGNKS